MFISTSFPLVGIYVCFGCAPKSNQQQPGKLFSQIQFFRGNLNLKLNSAARVKRFKDTFHDVVFWVALTEELFNNVRQLFAFSLSPGRQCCFFSPRILLAFFQPKETVLLATVTLVQTFSINATNKQTQMLSINVLPIQLQTRGSWSKRLHATLLLSNFLLSLFCKYLI